jgi:hypothetical protein
MIGVADGPDGAVTALFHQAHLTGRHFQMGEFTLLCHQLDMRPGASCDLSAPARKQFHIMDRSPQRHRADGKSIAGPHFRFFTGHHGIINAQTFRSQDITFLTINIMQKSDMGRAIGIIFYRRHPGRDIVLISPEIDNTVMALMTASAMPGGNATPVVSPAGFL